MPRRTTTPYIPDESFRMIPTISVQHRIPLQTHLNIDYFKFMLFDYEDAILCEFLEFGFPIGYMGNVQQRSPNSFSFVRNHNGAKEYPIHVQVFRQRNESQCHFRSFQRKSFQLQYLFVSPEHRSKESHRRSPNYSWPQLSHRWVYKRLCLNRLLFRSDNYVVISRGWSIGVYCKA